MTMNYAERLRTVPEQVTGDPLWTVEAYRLALFLADVAWHDVTKLVQDKRALSLADQLYDAVGSVRANISEGYSRGTGKGRARFYEYALGSAREYRTWSWNGRHVLGAEIADHRFRFLTLLIRLLLTMIPDQRARSLQDDKAPYHLSDAPTAEALVTTEVLWPSLLCNVPLP